MRESRRHRDLGNYGFDNLVDDFNHLANGFDNRFGTRGLNGSNLRRRHCFDRSGSLRRWHGMQGHRFSFLFSHDRLFYRYIPLRLCHHCTSA